MKLILKIYLFIFFILIFEGKMVHGETKFCNDGSPLSYPCFQQQKICQWNTSMICEEHEQYYFCCPPFQPSTKSEATTSTNLITSTISSIPGIQCITTPKDLNIQLSVEWGEVDNENEYKQRLDETSYDDGENNSLGDFEEKSRDVENLSSTIVVNSTFMYENDGNSGAENTTEYFDAENNYNRKQRF
ncbi:hypothetical protein Mgra_00005208 [Meloidogyne graminicola]|uniref:Uncharacterized protein n=1 Tax=Meloidogyne graminicola TaxID=189291 RepID=A0A8S9ZQG3_9BILA|nr:hypothetical protein Mgra_00005208 [Meloidogyne graminicola]